MRNRRCPSEARGGARVRVRLAGFRQEPPVVGGCTERELEHAIGCVLVRLAVAVERRAEPGEERAAGPDDELPDSMGVVQMATVVLRREALVVVAVSAQQDLDAGVVEIGPHRLHARVVALVTSALAALLSHSDGALRRMAAMTFRNHLSAVEPVPHPPIRSHSELIATMCQLPRSRLYQPFPAVPARLPKYRKYPDAFDWPYSWLPPRGMSSTSRAPMSGRTP